MTHEELIRLRNTETNVKTLEKRIIQLETEMALCLRALRIQAEKAAREKDPSFKVHEKNEA